MHSVWLCPSDQGLSDAILNAMQRAYPYCNNNAQSITFQPHVTVLSTSTQNIPVFIKSLKETALKYAPVISNLGKVEQNPQPENMYQCVYIRIDILEEIRNIRKSLGVNDDPCFCPHISLVYGKLSVEERNNLIQTIGEDKFLKWPAVKWDKLVLVCTEHQTGEFPWTKWKIIEQYELTGNQTLM